MINSEMFARFWMLGGIQSYWSVRSGVHGQKEKAYNGPTRGVTVHVKTNFDGSFNGNGSCFAFPEVALGKNLARPHGHHEPLQSRVHIFFTHVYYASVIRSTPAV